MRYPVTLTKDDNDTYLVTFPDVPDAVTFGDTKEEALSRAADALLTVFDAYMKDRRDVPRPSERSGVAVELPALETSKIELYRAMLAGKIGKSELAKRLNWHLPQVDRVLDVHHGSQIDQIEAALSAVGKKLVLTVVDSPSSGTRVAYRTTRVVHRAGSSSHRVVPGAIVTAALRQRGGESVTATSRSTPRRVVKRAAKKR